MPAYDVEAALRHVRDARANPDELTRHTMVLAGDITDGFRRDFGDKLDMETVGLALSIAASALTPLAKHREVPPLVLANTLAFAGEELVRTARAARAAQPPDVDEPSAPEPERVLTWRPLNGAPPVQIPFGQHWTFKADTCGQFTLSTRDAPSAAEGGESCRS
jgi:hypothetical protein